MIRKIKNFVFFFLVSFLFLNSTLIAQAQNTLNWEDVPISNKGDNKVCVIDEVATIQGFECLFYNILQVVVFFAGIASFIMFIVGGYKYLFSQNDPKKTAEASSTLTMAVLGIVGIIAAWLIISLIKNFTGADVTEFAIPGWQ